MQLSEGENSVNSTEARSAKSVMITHEVDIACG